MGKTCLFGVLVFSAVAVRAERIELKTDYASCVVETRGARIMSFKPADGEEVVWQADPVQIDDPKWAHGGIPVCWPWFGKPPREGLPKHGLARYAQWRLEEKIGKNALRWSLVSTPETMKIWPHAFRLDYTVRASGRKLTLELKATNTGTAPFEACGGFHPYFKVGDPQKVALNGAAITEETVSVTKPADGKSRELSDLVTGRRLVLRAKGNEDWYAWNPGRARTPLCVTLGPDEWRQFFCVEPYTATPHVLKPGESCQMTLTVECRE